MIRQAGVRRIVLAAAVLAGCSEASRGPSAPAVVSAPVSTFPASPSPSAGGGIVGDYAMTLEIGAECAIVPEADRTRRYEAAIAPNPQGGYLATLAGSTFLAGPICTEAPGRYAGIRCDQFFVSTDGARARFSLETADEAFGGHVVERTAGGTWMEIFGVAEGTIAPAGIEASGRGHVSYCKTPSADPFPCPGLATCEASLRLTFARR